GNNPIEKLYAINPDGTVQWIFRPSGILASPTTETPSSPAVGPDGAIYFGSMNTFLFALNPDGSVRAGWPQSPSGHPLESSSALRSMQHADPPTVAGRRG